MAKPPKGKCLWIHCLQNELFNYGVYRAIQEIGTPIENTGLQLFLGMDENHIYLDIQERGNYRGITLLSPIFTSYFRSLIKDKKNTSGEKGFGINNSHNKNNKRIK